MIATKCVDSIACMQLVEMRELVNREVRAIMSVSLRRDRADETRAVSLELEDRDPCSWVFGGSRIALS